MPARSNGLLGRLNARPSMAPKYRQHTRCNYPPAQQVAGNSKAEGESLYDMAGGRCAVIMETSANSERGNDCRIDENDE